MFLAIKRNKSNGSRSLLYFCRLWISPWHKLRSEYIYPLNACKLKRRSCVCGSNRKKWDGFCPFWSGGQVWADNCRACAAETDDYRVYCLSQAQSTLPHVPDSAHSLPLDLWGSVALSSSLRLHHGHYIAWILSPICFLPLFHLTCTLYFSLFLCVCCLSLT